MAPGQNLAEIPDGDPNKGIDPADPVMIQVPVKEEEEDTKVKED